MVIDLRNKALSKPLNRLCPTKAFNNMIDAYLKDIEFPATRTQIIDLVKQNSLPPAVVSYLDYLPELKYQEYHELRSGIFNVYERFFLIGDS